MNDLLSKCESELSPALKTIQMPRTPFQLQHFVVGQHDTEPRRWHQCVLEMQIKLFALRRAQISRRQLCRKIGALRRGDDELRDQAALLQVDLEEQDLAIIGAVRELETLYAIFKAFPRTYTREELDAAEAEYWQKRLTRQAKHELIAQGRVGIGNLESLEQIGQPLTTEFVRRIEQELCLPSGD
jgi:hypothetical protein